MKNKQVTYEVTRLAVRVSAIRWRLRILFALTVDVMKACFSASSAARHSSSTPLPSSPSSDVYPAARTAAATGPERSSASLHCDKVSCERARKLHATCPGCVIQIDPVLIEPELSFHPSVRNLCDLALEPAEFSVHRGRNREKRGDFTCAGSPELYSVQETGPSEDEDSWYEVFHVQRRRTGLL